MESIRRNLQQYAVTARIDSGSDELGVGLWLPASAVSELAGSGAVEDFARFLSQRRLRPFTINGFPYDNFHQEVVKHRVYEPTWWEPARVEYTKRLADVLAMLLPDDGSIGSISTLPIAWNSPPPSDAQLARAGANFRDLATYLRQIELDTGRRIMLAMEPEPGCVLDTVADVVRWFAEQLPDSNQRRYLSICHDICHSAVMMERQTDVIDRLAAEEIAIGKIQVSNAVVAGWNAMAGGRRREAIDQLREFAEDRYLHQTGRLTADGGFQLAPDLATLLGPGAEDGDRVRGDQKWVVHFHVPIFVERFGHLGTSQHDIRECLAAITRPDCPIEFSGHLEIETYAWSVLPAAMRKCELSADIAAELRWLQGLLATS